MVQRYPGVFASLMPWNQEEQSGGFYRLFPSMNLTAQLQGSTWRQPPAVADDQRRAKLEPVH